MIQLQHHLQFFFVKFMKFPAHHKDQAYLDTARSGCIVMKFIVVQAQFAAKIIAFKAAFRIFCIATRSHNARYFELHLTKAHNRMEFYKLSVVSKAFCLSC